MGENTSGYRIYSGERCIRDTPFGFLTQAMMLMAGDEELTPSPFAEEEFYGRMDYGRQDRYGSLALAHSILYTEYIYDHHLEHAEHIANTHYEAFAKKVIGLLPSKIAEEMAGISIGWMIPSTAVRRWVEKEERRFDESGDCKQQ